MLTGGYEEQCELSVKTPCLGSTLDGGELSDADDRLRLREDMTQQMHLYL
jgi:hypothetical protein